MLYHSFITLDLTLRVSKIRANVYFFSKFDLELVQDNDYLRKMQAQHSKVEQLASFLFKTAQLAVERRTSLRIGW